jgi:hypothetical protein
LQQYLAVLDHKIDYYSHEKERLEQ